MSSALARSAGHGRLLLLRGAFQHPESVQGGQNCSQSAACLLSERWPSSQVSVQHPCACPAPHGDHLTALVHTGHRAVLLGCCQAQQCEFTVQRSMGHGKHPLWPHHKPAALGHRRQAGLLQLRLVVIERMAASYPFPVRAGLCHWPRGPDGLLSACVSPTPCLLRVHSLVSCNGGV
jgi:hypothetical protein